MAISVGDAVLKLGVDTKDLDKGMSGIGDTIKKHQKAIGIGMVAMGGAIIAMGVASVKAYADMGDEVHKMSLRTGFATETLSRLKYAAGIGGASLADVEKAAKRMSTTILDAKDGLAETVRQLDRLGIAVEDFEGKSPEEQFMMLSEALSNVEDASERAAIAQKVFGRAGTALLPMLADGTEGLRAMMTEAEKFAPIFDKEAAVAAATLTDQMGQLKGATDKFKVVIAEQLIPTLIPLIEDLKEVTTQIIAWTEAHPELTKRIIIFTSGLGLLLIPMGTLLIFLPSIVKSFQLLKIAILASYAAFLKWVAIAGVALAAGLALGLAVWNLQRLFEGKEPLTFAEYLRILGNDLKYYSNQLLESAGLTADLKSEMDTTGQAALGMGYDIEEGTDIATTAVDDMVKAQQMALEQAKSNFGAYTKSIIDMQAQLLNNLRSAVGVGAGLAESLLSGQLYNYPTYEAYMAAMAEMGNIWTGTGWITPQHTPGQYAAAQAAYGTPWESAFPGDFEPFANEGIAMRPMLASIAERKPEAVLSIDRLQQMVSGGGYRTANIIFEVDGRTLARIIGEPLVDEIRLRTGVRI